MYKYDFSKRKGRGNKKSVLSVLIRLISVSIFWGRYVLTVAFVGQGGFGFLIHKPPLYPKPKNKTWVNIMRSGIIVFSKPKPISKVHGI